VINAAIPDTNQANSFRRGHSSCAAVRATRPMRGTHTENEESGKQTMTKKTKSPFSKKIKTRSIETKRIPAVEAIAQSVHEYLYDMMNEQSIGPRTIADATIFALIDFVANEGGAIFPEEMWRLRHLLEEQADALIERANS
jgi:hypothetical protein